MKSTATLPVIGMDIAKNVFQLHLVDVETEEITLYKLKRDRVAEFFANRQPSLVAMEACGGAHHWARTLLAMGHQVKLLPPKHVRHFVLRYKTDARTPRPSPEKLLWLTCMARALHACYGAARACGTPTLLGQRRDGQRWPFWQRDWLARAREHPSNF